MLLVLLVQLLQLLLHIQVALHQKLLCSCCCCGLLLLLLSQLLQLLLLLLSQLLQLLLMLLQQQRSGSALAPSVEPEHEVECGLLLDVVVR